MQTMKTVSAVVALLVLLVSLGLSGCANQTKSETGALLTQDYRKMDNDELTLYYYRLTEEIDRTERSGSGSAISIGIGGGSWGWGRQRRRRGRFHDNARGRRRRHGRFTQPPRRGPGGDAEAGDEAALKSSDQWPVKNRSATAAADSECQKKIPLFPLCKGG